jgi:TfoX/Sxy family transcriptional regulator of competence genes
MASDKGFSEYVLDQLCGAGNAVCRKMFGEYGVYLDSVIVGLICDNQLFIKPTQPGREFIERDGRVKEAPPHPGAKPYFLVDDRLDDAAWLCGLAKLTVANAAKRYRRIR